MTENSMPELIENTPHIRIRPSRGWSALALGELWQYRELLYFLVWREIKARYRQMALGPLWMVLVPLVNMLIMTVVFNKVAGIQLGEKPYFVLVYAGLIPWHLFANAAGHSASSLVNNLRVISKVYFPRFLIPLASIFVGLLDFLISLAILLVMMMAMGFVPTAGVLFLPVYVLLAMSTALAIGSWLAALSVKFRDVRLAITILLQLWLYLSPVIYPATAVPERWRTLYRMNPMASVVEGFRWALLGEGRGPDWILAVSAAGVLVLLVTGVYVFRRTERTIVDYI